jgi:hypothetical protein
MAVNSKPDVTMGAGNEDGRRWAIARAAQQGQAAFRPAAGIRQRQRSGLAVDSGRTCKQMSRRPSARPIPRTHGPGAAEVARCWGRSRAQVMFSAVNWGHGGRGTLAEISGF